MPRPLIREILAGDVIAGCLMHAGIDPLAGFDSPAEIAKWDQHTHYAEQVFGPTGCNLHEAAKRICELSHIETTNTRDNIQAAFSSAVGSDVFSGLMNQLLVRAFRESPNTYAGWVAVREVSDFKTNRRTRIQASDSLDHIPRGGTADVLTLRTADVETYKAARYGRRFEVDEQDLADSDVDILREAATTLARGSARLRSDLVYSVLMSNPTLADGFSLFDASDHANLNTSSALDVTQLGDAIEAMRILQENGVNLDLEPTHLIVPPGLEETARGLLQDRDIRGARNLQLAVEVRLQNGVTNPADGSSISGSATTWYLASNRGETLELGVREMTPSIRRYDLGRGQWGIGILIADDSGTCPLGYRALQQNTA